MEAQRVKIVDGGKLVIPAAMRRELGITTGDTVLVDVDDGELCGSAWKKDPGSGVIGVEKGPLIPVV